MEHFPALLSRAESDALAARIRREMDERGFGLWALEAPGVASFIGYTGLSVPRFSAHFTPCVEIGWRIAREHWGRGFASDAACAALEQGFGALGLDEIVSFTSVGNARSRRVMERIGMTHDPADDFEHPGLAPGHPLRRHVLYRIRRDQRDSFTRSASPSRAPSAASSRRSDGMRRPKPSARPEFPSYVRPPSVSRR